MADIERAYYEMYATLLPLLQLLFRCHRDRRPRDRCAFVAARATDRDVTSFAARWSPART